MTLIVLKFGGTSLANIKLMKNAVAKVIDHVNLKRQVVVVVSAMAGVTDHLVSLVSEITNSSSKDSSAEYANVITTGEQVSAGLFALLLQEAGLRARSWLSWQTGIITDENLSDGEIIEVNSKEIEAAFNDGYQVAVVAGFQGVTKDKRNSTLGRGGSDTSAIVLAGALNAQSCDIYTDVEGIFTGDPRIIAKAQKINYISYDEMIAFASAGAKVLQAKSVKWAKHYQVKLQVLSSFTSHSGTMVVADNGSRPVIGIALSGDISNEYSKISNLDIAKISVIGTSIESNDKLINQLKTVLEDSQINILSIQKLPMVLSFIINEEHKFDAMRLLHTACDLN